MLSDCFPYSMEDNESEKVVDTRDGNIISVIIDVWDYSDKIKVKLTPRIYSYDEFTDEELANFGIER